MAVDPGAVLQRLWANVGSDDGESRSRARQRTRQIGVDYGFFAIFAVSALVGVWLFLNHDQAFLRDLLRDYWLPALFLVFILEGAMLLYFAPSESLVPVAVGMTIETQVAPATPAVWIAIIGVATAGATLGQYVLFRVAQRAGREAILNHRWVRISDRQLARFEVWFERWGVVAVPVSNTLLFTRGMVTIPAGLADMRDAHFIGASALGTVVFEGALAFLTIRALSLPGVSALLP